MNKNIVFTDHIAIQQRPIPKDAKIKYMDNLFQSMEQQHSRGEVVRGLQVRARVTHAGRLTSHYHLYMPVKVKRATHTWTSPKRPVLKHHNDSEDPIGYVDSAQYIDTWPLILPSILKNKIYALERHTEDTLKPVIDKLYPYIIDPEFEGLGHIQVTANILDKDAIEKILDGRYYTISIGYKTDNVLCSVCYNNAFSDDCDHVPGHTYDNKVAFLIYDNLKYLEMSYVNIPADELAINESYKIADLKPRMTHAMDSDTIGTDIYRIPNVSMNLYSYDNLNDMYIPAFIYTHTTQTTNYGVKMKLTTLKRAKDLYNKLCQFIPEEKRLSEDQLANLPDTDFVGKRLFPAVDLEHIEAAKQLLESVDDCDEKIELMNLLNNRADLLKSMDSNIPEDQQESNEQAAQLPVDTNDSTNTQDEQQQNNNTNSEPEQSQTVDISALLPTLSIDEVKNIAMQCLQILAQTHDNLDEVLKDYVDEYQFWMDSYKNEVNTLKNVIKAKDSAIQQLSSELKNSLVGEILSYIDKENPNMDKEQLKSELTSQTLNELRATKKNLEKLFGSRMTLPSPVDDIRSHKYQDNVSKQNSITPEYIEKLKNERDNVYAELFAKNAARAEEYYQVMTQHIEQLIEKLNQQ